MDFEFTAEEYGIARSVAAKFPRWWRDDAYNCALEAIWQGRVGGCEDAAWLCRKARFFATDEMRREFGRVGFARSRAYADSVSIDDAHLLVADRQTPEYLVVDMNTNLCHLAEGWSDTDIAIVEQICAGKLKQEIASDIGVSPGRVSQLLRSVKASIAECIKVA